MNEHATEGVSVLRVLSLGAGVQSTTLALMAAHGEIAPIDYAIFADTQSEPASVYAHLEKLRAPGVLPFSVIIVTKGSLRQELLDAAGGKRGAWGRPPLFLKQQAKDKATGIPIVGQFTKGMTNRQCTQDYKLDLIYREVRRIAGLKRGSRGPKTVTIEQIIGISIDEAHRQKDARFRWIRNTYPLIDHGMNRLDCVAKLATWGWSAPKSACTFCPYHDDAMWQTMKLHDPVSFADAVNVDRSLRSGVNSIKGEPYLHEALIPLEDVDFAKRLARPKRKKQLRLYLSGFGNECEGMCGV